MLERRPLKIAIVGHSLHGGGAEYVTRLWADALVERGHSVSFIATDTAVEREWVANSVGVSTVARQGDVVRHGQRVLRLRRAVRRGGYDVCLGMQTYPSLVLLIAVLVARSSTRVVVSERSIPSILLRREGRAKRIQMLLAGILYRRADAAVAISHPVAADLVARFRVSPERIFVVPNPAAAKRRTDAGPKAQNGGTGIVLVVPARMVRAKRPLLVLQTAQELARRGRDVQVLFFGDGPLRGEIAEAAKELAVSVIFRGWVEDWVEQLPPSAVVVLSSYCEGFGNVLVEAAAAGVPSVAVSSALGVADAIVPGITGQLALTSRPEALATAVQDAALLDVARVDDWLRRFSVQSSVDALETALSSTAAD
jgi:glycosyltransferase involved in cell wall biosynthesis